MEFRIYCLNVAGRIAKRHDFEGEDEREAVAYARSLKHRHDCEIWAIGERPRLVTIIHADSD